MIKLPAYGLTIIYSLITCSLILSSAYADNLNSEMSFRRYNVKLHDGSTLVEIQADGGITANTSDQFRQFLANNKDIPKGSEVYFTSGGGKLIPALELGRIIRQHGFDTVLGAHQQVSTEAVTLLRKVALFVADIPFRAPVIDTAAYRWPSYCVSACTFAFLGGVHRYVDVASIYAVHKFNTSCDSEQMKQQKICLNPAVSESSAQGVSAELAVYLEEMGVPEIFLRDMVMAEPNQLNVFNEEQFKKYHICTGLCALH